MVCASQLVRPRSTAFSPRLTPHANMRRLNGEASMICARTLAAICSHTRGARNMKVGAISLRSVMTVSGSSTKLSLWRHTSG